MTGDRGEENGQCLPDFLLVPDLWGELPEGSGIEPASAWAPGFKMLSSPSYNTP
jgi:hypothetical protein